MGGLLTSTLHDANAVLPPSPLLPRAREMITFPLPHPKQTLHLTRCQSSPSLILTIPCSLHDAEVLLAHPNQTLAPYTMPKSSSAHPRPPPTTAEQRRRRGRCRRHPGRGLPQLHGQSVGWAAVIDGSTSCAQARRRRRRRRRRRLHQPREGEGRQEGRLHFTA